MQQAASATSSLSLLGAAGQIWAWILLAICFVILLGMRRLFEIIDRIPRTFDVQRIVEAIFWIVIAIILNYFASELSIWLYRAPDAELQFDSFRTLGEAAADGRIVITAHCW